ncbi:MAG: hypothetical protein ACREQ5_08085 [Candidatus Dormibacteria bacterium]
MASLSGTSTLTINDLYTSDSTIPGPLQLGQIAPGPHNKWFRYALAGASDLVAGNLLQEKAEDTQFEAMAVTASAIAGAGSVQTVNVTNGTTTVAAHDFDGGSISVNTTPDLGREYTILGHTTGASGAALVVTLDRPLGTAWSTSTKINMKPNLGSKVIQFPTSQTGVPVGVALFVLPTATYGWIQIAGTASALSDASSYAVGSGLSPSLSVAGCVSVNVAGTTHCNVGYARQAASSTHNIAVVLQIP